MPKRSQTLSPCGLGVTVMPKTADRVAPDWSHWLNMTTMSIEDAVNLSLNIDPRIVTEKGFQFARGLKNEHSMEIQERLRPYRTRLQQVEAALAARTLASNFGSQPIPLDRSQIRIELQNFIEWVTTLPIKWELPTEMESLISSKAPRKDNPKELTSYQKILIALIVKHYQYDPADEKSPVTSQIRRRLEDIGLSLDEETIRKCIKNSARHLKQGNFLDKELR